MRNFLDNLDARFGELFVDILAMTGAMIIGCFFAWMVFELILEWLA